MTWAENLPVFTAAIGVLTLPGFGAAWFLKLRGLWLLAASTAISVSIVVVASVLTPLIGLAWGPLPVIALSVLATIAAAALGRFVSFPTAEKRPRYDSWITAIGLIAGMAIIVSILVPAIAGPDNFAQRYDNIFHLNSVQYILDTGDASPSHVGAMTGNSFYPSGWHATVALIAQLSGASAVVATTVSSIVVSALVWIPAMTLLTTTLLPRPWLAASVGTPILASMLPLFPYLPLHYGVLLGFMLAVALMPTLLAALWRVCSGSVQGSGAWWQIVVLTVLLLPGVVGAHPSTIPAIAVLSLPFAAVLLFRGFRNSKRPLRIVTLVGISVVYLLVVAATLKFVRPPADQLYWPIITTRSLALESAVKGSLYGYPETIAITVLAAVGVLTAIIRPTRARLAVLGMATIGVALYVIVAAWPHDDGIRSFFTGSWYVNTPRLAMLWMIAFLPLAILGLGTMCAIVGLIVTRTLPAMRKPTAAAFAVPLCAVALIPTLYFVMDGPAMEQTRGDLRWTYVPRGASDDPPPPILSTDEIELMKRLPTLIPEDAVIAGDPWTGTSFVYAMSGNPTIYPHLLMDISPEAQTLGQSLSNGESPELCDALKETGVTYVLDFSAEGDFMEQEHQYPGYDNLDSADTVKLVDQVGGAKLFEVTACGLGN